MRKAVVLLVFFLAGCAARQPMLREDFIIRTELTAAASTPTQVFDKSKTWLTRHLYSRRNIIDYDNRSTGVIIANGSIAYPAKGSLEAINRIQYTISFTMREDIKDGKISITFYDLILDVPRSYTQSRLKPEEYTGGYSVPIEQRSDFEAARRGLLELASKLAEYLQH